MARETTQSIAVEADEKLLLDVLAMGNRTKPAALARQLLYRGLHDFLQDGEIHPDEEESEINESLNKHIEKDKRLKKLKEKVLAKRNQKVPKTRGHNKGKK